MTLTDIDLQDGQGNACGTQTKHLLIAPFSTLDLSVPDCWEAVTTLTYSYIDDGKHCPPAPCAHQCTLIFAEAAFNETHVIRNHRIVRLLVHL